MASSDGWGSDVAIDVSSTLRRKVVSLKRVRDVASRTLAAEKVRRAMLSIALVSRDRIAKLNRRFLRKRGDTDVIAFGFAPTGAGIVGDIYIAPDVAARNAKREMVSVGSEIDRLIVHGVLHVLGYDHPDTDARVKSKMWTRQEQILSSIAR